MWADSVQLVLRALDGLDEAQRVTVAPVSTEFSFGREEVRIIHLLDVLVHAWDLAASIGVDYQPSAAAVDAVSGMASLVAARAVPSTREQFAAPIRSADGDSGWGHLLRLLGRDPIWRSPVGAVQPPSLAAVSIPERLTRFSETWSPKIIGRVNDYEVKVVKMLGEFEWHSHHDTDELFVVISGHVRIEMRHGSVELGPGDLYIVPKGVEHRPVAEQPAESVLLEPAGVINTGDSGGALTAVDEVLI
jgi:mannose-6-phosphate isomerase-like protein (cupin superfamily)